MLNDLPAEEQGTEDKAESEVEDVAQHSERGRVGEGVEEQDNTDHVVKEQKDHIDPDASSMKEYEVTTYPQEGADHSVTLSPIRSSHFLHHLFVHEAEAQCHRLLCGER